MSDSPRDPVADLREIAYLLERTNAATPKVKAFRNAAEVFAAMDAEAQAAAGASQ